jgi:hypothetical protein
MYLLDEDISARQTWPQSGAIIEDQLALMIGLR